MRKQRAISESPEVRHNFKTVGQWIKCCFIAIVTLLILCTALAYLVAAFSAFTSFKFTLTDYGRYVNTIWNCAHGHPFRLLTEYSYLNTHLSFTLALLAPAFLLWDHPFSLWVAQWLLTLVGLFIMWRAAMRHKIPGEITAAFLLFYIANPFTQCVLLSEFHGVNLYLLLLPWLYFCLAFQRKMAWLPLILICGVREEAAFLVLPMLLYFSVRERWKTGYLLAVFSSLYGLFACTLLFRWINGSGLSTLRPDINVGDIVKSINKANLSSRLMPLLRLTAPVIPFLKKGWVPVLLFPAVALLVTIFSPYPAQYTLKYHYPAAPLICVVLGMLQGMSIFWHQQPNHPELSKWFQAIFLITVAVILHVFYGLLPLGRYNTKDYRHPEIHGLSALCAVSHLPKQGLLLCDRKIGGMCANRKDMIIWEQYQRENWEPDLIFTNLKDAARKHADTLRPALIDGNFGVSFFDGTHIIMARSYPPTENTTVLTAIDNAPRTIRFAYTRKKGGKERVTKDCRIVRYWAGKQQRGEILVAYGKFITLAPGDYVAVFRLKAENYGLRDHDKNGILRVVERTTQTTLARAEVEMISSENVTFFEQTLPFHLSRKTRVEPQVIGENSELWLDYVVLQKKSAEEK